MSNTVSTISPASAGHSLTSNTEATSLESNSNTGVITMTTNDTSFEDDFEDNTLDTEETDTTDDSGILPGIDQADPDLRQDAAERAEEEKERLADTSRENGSQGGRPSQDRVSMAMLCIANRFVDADGRPTLWHFNGAWHHYTGSCYNSVSDEEIEKAVTGFLSQLDYLNGAVTTSLVRDVLNNMKSDTLCSLSERTHEMPCFISTGADASGFLPMRNGILDVNATLEAIKTGSPLPPLLQKTADLFCNYGLNYDYNPEAECPKFLNYLEGVQPEPENRRMLQMMAGLLLLPDTSFNVAFFLYGQGGTGKTVFMDTLGTLIGPENCCCVPLACFADRFNNTPLTEKLVNIVDEMPVIPETGRFADIESVFKSVTSGNLIKVERKFVDAHEARATARCIFASNSLPTLTDKSNGIWDRIRIIPFNKVFRNTPQQNPHLTEELLEELPGILNWSLHGLVELRKEKTFPQCLEGEALLAELREDCDHEKTFLAETTMEAKAEKFVGAKILYDIYRDWMEDNGYRAMGAANFKHAVRRLYPTMRCGRKYGIRGYFGITFLKDSD